MTLSEVKDLVCKEYGHRDFLEFKIKCLKQANPLHDMIPMLDEVARRYASEQLTALGNDLLSDIRTNLN